MSQCVYVIVFLICMCVLHTACSTQTHCIYISPVSIGKIGALPQLSNSRKLGEFVGISHISLNSIENFSKNCYENIRQFTLYRVDNYCTFSYVLRDFYSGHV